MNGECYRARVVLSMRSNSTSTIRKVSIRILEMASIANCFAAALLAGLRSFNQATTALSDLVRITTFIPAARGDYFAFDRVASCTISLGEGGDPRLRWPPGQQLLPSLPEAGSRSQPVALPR